MASENGKRGFALFIAVMLVMVTVCTALVSCIFESDDDNIYSEMNYVSLGDSLTYSIDGETNMRMALPYPCLVSNELGFGTHQNLAVGGATLVDTYPDNNVFLQLERMPAKADVISVMIGCNDFLRSVPLGEMGDDTRSTVYGAYDILISELKDRFPYSFIFFITTYDVPIVPGDNSAGYSMRDIADVMIEVCDTYSIPVLDLNSMVDFNMDVDPMCDRLHPSQNFTRDEIAPRVSKFIRDNFEFAKRYVALGDSITYGYASGGRMDKPYPTLVAERLGSVECINLAVSGASVSTVRGTNNTMVQLENVPLDADIISVMIGVNDFGSSAPLGDIDDRTQDTVYGGLNMLADSLQQRCPDAFIFFMTPFPFLGVGYNSEGYCVEDVADAVKEVCALRGIPVLDMYNDGCFSRGNDPRCDSLHPTQSFFERFTAPMVAEFISRNI